MKSTWEAVIGLEVHVQLATRSKLFSGSEIRFGAQPNALTDPTVLGLPGALPVCNKRAIEFAVRLGVAVEGNIRTTSRFARKQYFYPDLPKGYQISQYDEPIIEGGRVQFPFGGTLHSVALTRIHLEEDAGKSTHTGTHSLVDLNRAGIPLCEVVTEPCLRSAEEAREYMRALRRLVRALGISDGDMEKGQLRCDANVSLRPIGESALGTRAELKNINSFKFVKDAIEHEIRRQAGILDGGGRVVQETRLWDSDKGHSRSMRSKEDALDYRYFPDPDLPALHVPDALIDSVTANLPELPEQRRVRLQALGLADGAARFIVEERAIGDYFDAATAAYGNTTKAVAIANWIQGELTRTLTARGTPIAKSPVSPPHLAALVKLIDSRTISGKIAKSVFKTMADTGEAPDVIIEREGLVQISDESALETIAREVIHANPKQVEQYRGGKTKLLGFFVGQVMKQTQGTANPGTINQLFVRILEKP